VREAPDTGDELHCIGNAAMTLPQMHTEAVRLGAAMRSSTFSSIVSKIRSQEGVAFRRFLN